MIIQDFPSFLPISLEMRDELYPALNLNKDGVSEFTFSNLFLFRRTYGYRICRIPGKTFVISGEKNGRKFFMLPCDLPPKEIMDELFASHDYLKNLPQSLTDLSRVELERWGLVAEEDRDNFDYLYFRKDLAELSGKSYHKKRNLVNAFLNSYSYEEKPLSRETLPDAIGVLERWKDSKGIQGDSVAAREGLDLFDTLRMRGAVYYANGSPAGYTLGESLARGKMFAVHFEKADEEYKGIYQFVNQAFAQSLPGYFTYINREQDLGDEGLRQAKMTYRPCGFIRKYKVTKRV
jgi:hypothetical protein